MNRLPNCPKCQSEYVYEDGLLLVQSVLMSGIRLKSMKKMLASKRLTQMAINLWTEILLLSSRI